MLGSVASGKRLPEKNLLVLGTHIIEARRTPLASAAYTNNTQAVLPKANASFSRRCPLPNQANHKTDNLYLQSQTTLRWATPITMC